MAEIINTEIIPLSKIVGNRGQIQGLPRNPRIIKDEKFQLLCDSISAHPDMLYLRELLVYPSGSKFVVIGGISEILNPLSDKHSGKGVIE